MERKMAVVFFILFAMILVGCSSEKPQVASPNNNETTTDNSASTSDKSTTTSDTETYGTGNIDSYLMGFNRYSAMTTDATEVFNGLLKEALDNYSLRYDSTWQQEVNDVLQQMNIGVEGMRSLNPPSEFVSANELILSSMDENEFVIDHFLDAINTHDTDLLFQCTDAFGKAENYYFQAVDEIKTNAYK